ncbi:TPA: restriction endonuclease subunit S [Acinetobacter baumannii]
MSLVFKELGELVDFKGGGTPSRNVEEYWGNSISWATVKDLNEGITLTETQEFISELGLKNSASNLIAKGTIIIPTRMALGKVVISEIDVAINQDLKAVFVKDKETLDVKYLLRFLESNKENIASMGKGATVKGITLDQLKAIKIPLQPLAEQRRIAAILDKADELRQKRQQVIEKLDQLLQATFIDMFGDPVSNPKGWDIFKSKSLFQDPPRIGTTTPAKGEGIPVVRVGELGQFSINFKECGRVQISESDFKKYELKNGDLVLARAIGSKNQLGKCSYFSEYFEPVCIDSHVMRLRPDSKKMHPLWFYFLLSSDQGKKILQSKGGATAVQFNINSAQANDLDIALPPLIEQTKFVEIANKILKNKESHIRALEANTLLFSALQNQAFSGTL